MVSSIMGKTGKAEQSDVTYDIEDKPPIGEATALGFQHVCAMFLGNITVPLVIAGTLGLATGETTFLVQMAFIVAGSATLVQAFPIGPVGGRVPIMMGTSFAFLGPLRSVGEQFGLAAIYGAALVGSVVQLSLGSMYEHFERFFPPLVNGVVVMLIGLTLIPTGIDYAAGGADAAHYASLTNLGLATVAFLVTLGLNQFFEGILRIASVFFFRNAFGIYLGSWVGDGGFFSGRASGLGNGARSTEFRHRLRTQRHHHYWVRLPHRDDGNGR